MSHDILPGGTDRPDYPNDPLPPWVTELRDTQVDAVRQIIAAFEDYDIVYLDAPVGAGKTLIAELVRRELGVSNGLYICSDKALQDQFVRDFPYAKVLKGKANYIPTNAARDITCEDCTVREPGDPCMWCPETYACPYKVAKRRALGRKGEGGKWEGGAKVAVLNTAYMLLAGRINAYRNYDLVVADECDTLEAALIGFIEYEVPQWIGDLLELDYPKKGVHQPTLVAWLEEAAARGRKHLAVHGDSMEVKRRDKLDVWADQTAVVARDIGREEGDDQSGKWIREYGSDRFPVRTLKLRPVMVDHLGPKSLWRHGRKWLCMSGTIISAEELSDSLGQLQDYAVVTIPSTFPVENRPIISAPIANVTARSTEDDHDQLVFAINQICREHEGRVLVHSVSYKLTDMLYTRVDANGRHKVRYTSAAGKNAALREYLAHDNSIIFAPSMDRGVDLAGDKCAVQIIAKVPFPSLGDKQVSARLHMPGGNTWYQIKAIRDIVQMTGRGVRSPTDTCVTYILDRQFGANLYDRRNKHFFPEYFREATDERARINHLIKPRNWHG